MNLPNSELLELAGFVAAAGAVLGLLIGSFLNVVVYRVPNDLSIVSPPSACPRCGKEIRPYDNIPVASWLILRGRCRDCREPISIRYPIVEALTALFFVAVALRFLEPVWHTAPGPAPSGRDVASSAVETAAYLYFAAISLALALIDLDTRRLPNRIVLPSYGVGIGLLAIASVLSGDYSALLSAVVGGAALFVAYFVMALIHPGGMGLGDVKLAGVVGIFVGYAGLGPLLVGAFSAFVLGGLFALLLVVLRRAGRKSGIPFGPWMLAGAWIGIFAGDVLWRGYLSVFGLA
jgi:leader peptidase (prepilin peptidase)/N-methyltransferase